MSRTDEELMRFLERGFPDEQPGAELWETTRTAMRRRVRTRRTMVVASMVLVGALAVAVPQALLSQRPIADVEFADTPPAAETERRPDVSHTEKPLYLPTPGAERDGEDGLRGPAPTTPQPDAAPTPPGAPVVPTPPVQAVPQAPSQPPPPVTFTTHGDGERVPVGEVTVGGESCTYEATVYLRLVAPDGSTMETFTTATDQCFAQWQHTFVLNSPGVWTIIASGEGDDPVALTLEAF